MTTTQAPDSPKEGVTVVVPTLNRGDVLRDCLRDLIAQRHRPLEILVVDQSTTTPPEQEELVAANPDLISWHRVAFRGLPIARNYGWQLAKHDAILYIDDDIRCGPELVSEHLRALRYPGVGVVAGSIREDHRRTRKAKVARFNRWTATAHPDFDTFAEGTAEHARGGNFSVWRRVMEEAGGIDESFQVGAALHEETDFCFRVIQAGYSIRLNGKARLKHLAAGQGGCRIPDVAEYVWGYSHNRAILIRRHLPWYCRVTALARLMLLGVSYAFHYRSPKAMIACVTGCRAGLGEASSQPRCTDFRRLPASAANAVRNLQPETTPT